MTKRAAFSLDVLRMEAFLTMSGGPDRLTARVVKEFLQNVYPSLAAALALGFDEEDGETRQSFAYLHADLARLYDAAVAAWSTGQPVRLEHRDDRASLDYAGATEDLARVVACQHLGRDMQGGPHEFGFDLLADLLVSRLASRPEPATRDAESAQ